MEFLNKIVEQFIRANRKLKRWQRAVSILAAVVVFATTYAFVLPAITLDKETASTQSGIEIAASDNEPDGDGTVYEAEPEEPAEDIQDEESENSQEEGSEGPEENESEGPQDAEAVTEESGSQSGSQDAEVSEEDNSDEGTEAAGGQNTEEQAESEEAEKTSDDEDAAPDTSEDDAVADPAVLTDETLAEDETSEEIKLITEKTQLVYEYVDEEYENGIDDENEDGIDDGYFVYAEFGADAKLPQGVELIAEEITKESDPEAYEAYYEKALSGLQDKYDENTTLSFARFYDIKFVYNGKEVEPAGDVKVRIEYKKAVEIEKDTNVDAVHFDKDNEEEPEVIKTDVEAEKKGKDDTVKTVEFESDRFSVYGVIGSYTLDFHWEVDGKTYEFSIPGGGSVSLTDLVEVLGISGTEKNGENEADTDDDASLMLNDVAVSESTREFVTHVKNVEISDPDLVDVSKVDEDTTVGQIKNSRELEVLYSAELTEEQIAEINSRTVEAGDWALISMQPLNSEEVLTVTMNNDEKFSITLTDASINANCLKADGKDYRIRVTFDENEEIPDGTKLIVSEIENDSDVYVQHLGQVWYEINREYFEVEEKRANYNEGMGLLPNLHPVNVDDIRFFDISLECNGETVVPAAPVLVEISYDQGLVAPEADEPVAGIAKISNDKAEIIEDTKIVLDKDGGVTGLSFRMDKLSEIGTFAGQETSDTIIEPARMAIPLLKSRKTKETAVTKKSVLRAGLLRGGEDEEEEEGEELQLPDHPQASKTLSYNDDGTYTLALNVTGAADSKTQTEVTKSNVLIVMDRSSSMVNNNASETYREYSGQHENGVTYYGYYNGNYVQLYYNNGTYYRTNNNGWYSDRYTGTIFTRETQTRLAAEQAALNTLIGQLLGKNSDDTVTGEDGETISLDDVIQVKVISFASYRSDSGKNSSSSITHDGDFSDTESGWSTDENDLSAAVNDNSVAKGTNWEEALQYAKDEADAMKKEQPDEKVYVIFLTDGEPTDIANGNGNAQYWQDNERCLKAAWDDAQNIVTPHTVSTTDGEDVETDHVLYGIFTYGDTDAQKQYMRRLVNYAYGKGDTYDEHVAGGTADYYYDADSTAALLNAFENILSSITNALEFGRISITDGITTDAAATAVINGSARGFRYSVKGPVGELYSVTTSGNSSDPSVEFTIGTTTYSGDQVVLKQGTDNKPYYSVTVGDIEYKMALADIDANKKVTWDLSAIGTLMDGYTYTVEFAVWPDQDAYDYVAGLNNGLPGFSWDTEASTFEQVKDDEGNVLYEKGGVEQYPSIVRYPDESFAVLTNTDQTLTYSIVNTEKDEITGEETITYDGPHEWPLTPPNPMPLVKTKVAVEKIWESGLDPSEFSELLYENDIDPKKYTVELRIWKADTIEELQAMVEANGNNSYKDVTVGWDESIRDYVWSKELTVSPGHMVTLSHAESMGEDTSDTSRIVKYNGEDYFILEPGHYYTISEPGIDRHYELNCDIYHPMIIDGVLSKVTIKDGIVTEAVALSTLEADNTLKGGINVQKKVYDNKNQEVTSADDTFKITLEVKNKDGSPYTDFDYRIYYGENNPNYYDIDHYPEHRTGHIFGTAAPEDNEAEDTDDPQPYETQRHILHNTDGKITVELYVGDSLRLINAPAGTTYSVTEDTSLLEDCYEYVSTSYEISENDSNNYKLATPNSNGTYTVKGNSACLATVKNKVPGADVNIFKISAGNEDKPMSGVKFKLYYDEACKRQVIKDSIGHPVGEDIYSEPEEEGEEPELLDKAVLITGEDGKFELGTFISGYYYLKEISTWEGYVVTPKAIPIRIDEEGKVSYRQEDYSASYSSPLEVNEDGSFTITINNNPSVTLPNAGGPGTTMIYLLGLTLAALAGAGLVMSRRKKSA